MGVTNTVENIKALIQKSKSVSPDDDNVNIRETGGDTRHGPAMDQVDMKV